MTPEVIPANGTNGTMALAKVDNAGPLARESIFMPAMSMQIAVQRREVVVAFMQQIMQAGTDYGMIPGIDKPSLAKAGAEKLVNFFGLEPIYDTVQEIIDWTGAEHGGEPLYYVKYRCRLLKDGRVFGSCEGSANTWEQKHRYRWLSSDRIPPGINVTQCQKRGGKKRTFEPLFAIDKADTGGKYGKPAEYWQLFQDGIKSGAAKATTKKLGPKEHNGYEIEIDEVQYRVPNPEFADLINTCQKMGQKRSLVGACLIATSASEFFTQDVEDMPRQEEQRRPEPENEPERQPEQRQAAPRAPRQAKAQPTAPPAPKGPPPIDDSDLPAELGGTFVHPDPAPSGENRVEEFKAENAKPWKTFGEMNQMFQKYQNFH